MKYFSNDEHLLAIPGKAHNILDFNPDYTANLDKKDSEKLLKESVEKLNKIQDKLYANDRYAVLIIFQAMDAAGKDGTIKHVMSGINPQGCQVYSFKQPSTEELDHDYFWRAYKCFPERGRLGIFNRSYYEEVIVTKVHPDIILNQKLPGVESLKDIDDRFWKSRYNQINDIEHHLYNNGTLIIKFFLNVSKKEQKKRFLDRLDDPTKNWKFSLSDIKEREFWDKYMKAYSHVLSNTSTKYAPWYVIPANNKWFMRYVVSKIIIEQLSALDLTYPKLTDNALLNLESAKELLLNEE